MNDGVTRLLDPSILHQADLFVGLLVRNRSLSYLPELYEVFGPEKLVDFLDLFAGTTFEVPSIETLAGITRSLAIYNDLSMKGYNARELARKYDISETAVRETASMVRDIEKEIEVLSG